jgi:hypothetical protein
MCNHEKGKRMGFLEWLSRYHGILDAVSCAFLCVNAALLIQEVNFHSIVVGVIIFLVAFVMGLSSFVRTTIIERTSFSKFWFRGTAYILFALISIIPGNVLTYVFGIITIVIGFVWLFLGCIIRLDSRPLFCDCASQQVVTSSAPPATKQETLQQQSIFYKAPAGFQNPATGASKDAAWNAAAAGGYVPNPAVVPTNSSASAPPPPSKLPDNPFA